MNTKDVSESMWEIIRLCVEGRGTSNAIQIKVNFRHIERIAQETLRLLGTAETTCSDSSAKER